MSFSLRLDEVYCRFLDSHPCHSLLVALSGGADSVALLHLAYQYQAKYGYRLEALHVHHGIRGKEADRDLEFCRSFCQNLQIPFHAHHLDIPFIAKIEKAGLEETARKYRYQALETIASERQLDTIVTAHTATDNMETVLLQLTRGCSSVIGIPSVRGAYIRPLLDATRTDILSYLEAYHLPHIEDSSNQNDDYSRNLIRHRVLPVLLELNPQAEAAFRRAVELSREDTSYLDELAASTFCDGRIEDFNKLPTPLRSRALKAHCEQLGFKDLSYTHLQALSALVKKNIPHSSLSVPGGSISIENGQLIPSKKLADTCDWETVLQMGENFLPDGSILYLSTQNEEDLKKYISRQQNIYKLLTKAVVNFATIRGSLIARSRRGGDRIFFGGIHRSVKKLYCDMHIPLSIRQNSPIICDESSIIWIPALNKICDQSTLSCDQHLYMIWLRKGTDYEAV